MKFKDVHTMPRDFYKVDVGWNYLEKMIKEDEEDIGLDLNPDFQRAHVWTEQQQIAYVEYILKGGRSGKELYFNANNFPNVIGEYVIVDGKQRL